MSNASETQQQQFGALQPATLQYVTTPVSLGLFLTPASQCSLHASPVCRLKTAVAPVANGHIRMNANILFDEGAQRSFISVRLATELQITPTTTTQVHNYALFTDIEKTFLHVRLHEAPLAYSVHSNQRTQIVIFKFSVLLL